MPRVLSQTDVDEFRHRLCAAAERLFAERGPEAVTMRQLAAELGVSPMTPYRYFLDKDDILAAVRTNGFNDFAEALEKAHGSAQDALSRSKAVGEAYVDFAFERPHTYKLMFDLNQPQEARYPHLVRAGERARATMSAHVKALIADGLLSGDPLKIGAMFWAAAHGAIVLELAGKLPPGAARELHRDMGAALTRGLRPDS
jgi:AcrR family transcriptional regulator